MVVEQRTRRLARSGRESATPWYDSPWRIAARAVASAVVIMVVAGVVALAAVPRLTGGDSLTVLSGSMEPTFSAGDVVVVRGIDQRDVCSDVSVGSIVTFFPEPDDPTLITHRVVGKTIGAFADGTDCRLITQGDANSAADAPVSPSQVRGLFLFGVPGLGWIRQWVADNPLLVVVGIGAAAIAWLLFAPRRSRSTVITLPRSADTVLDDPASSVAPRSPAQAAAPAGVDTALHERELALRERELELRERELELALRRASAFGAIEQSSRDATPDETTRSSRPTRPWSEQ